MRLFCWWLNLNIFSTNLGSLSLIRSGLNNVWYTPAPAAGPLDEDDGVLTLWDVLNTKIFKNPRSCVILEYVDKFMFCQIFLREGFKYFCSCRVTSLMETGRVSWRRVAWLDRSWCSNSTDKRTMSPQQRTYLD